jgi:N-acetyltransferase
VSPNKRTRLPTQSTLSNFFALPTKKVSDNHAGPSKKRPLQSSETKNKKSKDDNILRQMHLTHLPLLHTCQQCQMSYVRGGDDEGTHEKHHARVTRGIIWDGLGRGKGKGKRGEGADRDNGWRVVRDNVPFGPGGKGKGRIIVADGSYGGSKVCPLLSTQRDQSGELMGSCPIF